MFQQQWKQNILLQLLPFPPPSFHLQYFWNIRPCLQSPIPDQKGFFLPLPATEPGSTVVMVVVTGCQI